MKKLDKIIEYGLYLLIVFLPFQTRWIYRQGELNGAAWEYGTLSLYATEMLFFVILVLAIIVAIGQVKNQENKKSKNQLRKQMAVVISIFTILAINVFAAVDKEIAFYKLEQIIAVGALFFVIILIKLNFNRIAWALTLSGLVQGALAIQQFVEQKVIANKWLGMAEQLPQTLGAPVVQIGDERWLRAFGSFPHPNFLAGFLVVSLIFTIGLFLLSLNRKHGRLLSAILVVQFLALLTALSRAGFVVFSAGTIFLLTAAYRDTGLKQKITSVVAVLLFILIAFSVSYPQLIVSRAVADSRVENLSNATRVEQYNEWRQIIKTNWLTGVGLGNYTLALSELKPNLPAWAYQPIHNVYLLVFAELGLFGLFACLLFFIHFVYSLIKLDKTVFSEKTICFTCLACLACLAFFDHYLWSFWGGMALASIVLALLSNWQNKTGTA